MRYAYSAGPAPARHCSTVTTNAAGAVVMPPARRIRRRENHGRTDGAVDAVNASANCAALTNRSAGALANALDTAPSMAGGIVSRSRRTDGTGSVSCFAITLRAFAPV